MNYLIATYPAKECSSIPGLRLPDKIQKTKNQSVHPGLRKRPKGG